MAADHLLSAEVVLSDGSLATFSERSLPLSTLPNTLEAAFYSAALHIRQHYAETIRSRWPRTWRRASGYGLNYLLPWSPGAPPLGIPTNLNQHNSQVISDITGCD
jgi:hypothetical protein